MQIDFIARQVHRGHVTHVDPKNSRPSGDMHVVFRHRKSKRMCTIHNRRAQLGVAGSGVVCKTCHKLLELPVVKVNRNEEGKHTRHAEQDGDSRRDAPPCDRRYFPSPGSLLEAYSSSQMSSECGVHSGFARPDICNSSAFSVP